MGELIAGLFSLLVLLMGGLGAMLRRWIEQTDASHAQFQAEVKGEIRSLREAMDRDYVLREPHLKAHDLINDRLSRHESRMNSLEARIKQWEQR